MTSSRRSSDSTLPTSGVESPRALIVESEFGARTLSGSALRAAGFSVHAVDTGVAGIATARDLKPDLILVDFHLRDVAGPEFLRWLCSNSALCRVPVIAIGAIAGEQSSRCDGQVVAWLSKPLSRMSLLRAARKIARSVPSRVPSPTVDS